MAYTLDEFHEHVGAGDPVQITNIVPGNVDVNIEIGGSSQLGGTTITLLPNHVVQVDGVQESENLRTLDLGSEFNSLEILNSESMNRAITQGLIEATEGTYLISVVGLGKSGSVFITDIVPTAAGNVGGKVFSSDGEVLDSCVTDTDLVTVSVLALPGYTNYKAVVTISIGDQAIPLSISGAGPIWTGSLAVDLAGATQVEVSHEDGATYTSAITHQAGPNVVSAVFSDGTYPGSQTELAEDNKMNLTVTSDVPMTGITVYDDSACQAEVFTFASTTTQTVAVTIADRGDVATLRYAKIKCKDSNDAFGDDYLTNAAGVAELVNVVSCNNLHPTASFGSVTYPATQSALKDSETAAIAVALADLDTILFSSPNSQLSITDPVISEATKTVTRIAGDYNISANNLQVIATRNANATTTTDLLVVQIAHIAVTVSMSPAAARLRSGGNYSTTEQNHTITLTTSQSLASAPSMDAPQGDWQGGGFAGGPTIWTRLIGVHDDDTKGIYSFTNLSATNLAGKVTATFTGSDEYTLGGFVLRTLTVAAWTNRETDIGTFVADTAKLRCSNLSKGASGSLNCTFVASVANDINTYTITDPTATYNANGDMWYNRDLNNAVGNTSGLMRIELEEIV